MGDQGRIGSHFPELPNGAHDMEIGDIVCYVSKNTAFEKVYLKEDDDGWVWKSHRLIADTKIAREIHKGKITAEFEDSGDHFLIVEKE